MQVRRSLLTSCTDREPSLGKTRRKLVLIFGLLFMVVAFRSATAFAQSEFPQPNSIYKSGSFPLASCKSWNGTITEIVGANTSKASMSGVVTREDVLEYCSRMQGDDEAKQAACLKEEATRLRGEFSLTSTADCSAGRIKTTDEKEYQLRGLGGVWLNGDYSLTWQHVRSGKLLDGSCASGAPPITEQFKLLCPAAVERLVGPLRSYLDESYWARFWRVDQRGIYDTNQKKLVFSIQEPEEGLKSARAVFAERKVTTAQEESTRQILTYNMIFKFNGKDIYYLEVDQSDRRRGARITKLTVSSPNISDAAGVRVGSRLIDVAGYNWKKLCEEYEAQVNCRSPYSSKVTYVLDDDVVTGRTSIQSILSKSKVKEIEVEALH